MTEQVLRLPDLRKSVLAAAHLNLGRLHSTRGQHAEAIDAYRQATTHAQNAGWPHGQATAIGNIGTGYLGDGAVRSWEAVPGWDRLCGQELTS